MEISAIENEGVREWIKSNMDYDLHKLLLKGSPFNEISIQWLTDQIRGRKLAKKKFPFLINYDRYIYPPKVSLEQSSSELTALYKSILVGHGNSFIDLTGGMGIDTAIIGRRFNDVYYVDSNEQLVENAQHNLSELALKAQCYQTNAEDFLLSSKDSLLADLIYIDPSRRVDGSRKTGIFNCIPDVVSLQNEMLAISNRVLMKLSPMQDISECLEVFERLQKIVVVAVRNEVKELLVILSGEENLSPCIDVVELKDHDVRNQLSFSLYERTVHCEVGAMKEYIYQPHPAIVKGQLQNAYARQFGLRKLHANTQLFTSESSYSEFMGRVFKVEEELTKKNLIDVLPNKKANIISKNYPLSPSQIAKKWKIQEGGNQYLLAFNQEGGERKLVVCTRII